MDIRLGQSNVSDANLDVIPLIDRAGVIYISQCIAAMECAISYYDNTPWNRHARQTFTPSECIGSNFCHSVRNRNTLQTITLLKSIFTDTRYSHRNSYACQFFTAGKRIIPDTIHAVRNLKIPSQRPWNHHQSLLIFAVQNRINRAELGIIFVNLEVYQFDASGECTGTNFRNTFRNRNALQIIAPLKSSFTNRLYTIRNRDF